MAPLDAGTTWVDGNDEAWTTLNTGSYWLNLDTWPLAVEVRQIQFTVRGCSSSWTWLLGPVVMVDYGGSGSIPQISNGKLDLDKFSTSPLSLGSFQEPSMANNYWSSRTRVAQFVSTICDHTLVALLSMCQKQQQ